MSACPDIPGAPRVLTPHEASAVYDILVAETGARPGEREKWSFVRYATAIAEWNHIFVEWRFCGSLGFGGKFRFDGFEVPNVNCYREHETPERLAIIERANERLAALFVLSPSPFAEAGR